MIEIIIVIAYIYILFRIWTNNSFFYDTGLNLFSSFMVTVGAALFLLFSGAIGQEFGTETHRTECSDNIYSLRNENNISGQFFLGGGQINTTEYYCTFRKQQEGGLYRVKLPANSCIIFQDENKRPHLDWQQIHYRPAKWAFIWPKCEYSKDSMYYLHVPTNTIIEQFKLN